VDYSDNGLQQRKVWIFALTFALFRNSTEPGWSMGTDLVSEAEHHGFYFRS
jgi:hypothetical protein